MEKGETILSEPGEQFVGSEVVNVDVSPSETPEGKEVFVYRNPYIFVFILSSDLDSIFASPPKHCGAKYTEMFYPPKQNLYIFLFILSQF